jgi:electron-transferring-flavoprotein dehydrogenase
MEGGSGAPETIEPARSRPALPVDQVILGERPGEDAVPLDVLFVGAGPAGLAGAIELARLVRERKASGGTPAEIEIGVLDKAGELGEHCLSGAVLNVGPFRELFPDLADADFPFRREVGKEAVYLMGARRALRVPVPPTMRNGGNRVASICEVVRWMGRKAEELGVNIFPGYPADGLLVDGSSVVGVRTTPSGLNRDGSPGSAYVPAMDLAARVTVLAEGSRGLLSQCWFEWQRVSSTNPQIYALGVKELWEVTHPLGHVIHTLGWPLPDDTFGGSWIYPMDDGLVSLGLVVGLDYPHASLDVHGLLQELKTHPLVGDILRGGSLVEWGAKTIPEGGYHSIPKRRHGDGLCVVGDAAGYVNVPSLKGIHYAVHSGILAARAIFRALEEDDTSEEGLRSYTEAVDASFIMDDLKATRNMRLSFKSGLYAGGLKAGMMMLTGGRFPGGSIPVDDDAEVPKKLDGVGGDAVAPDGKLTFSKSDAVFRSGNRTRDDIPVHLTVPPVVSNDLGELYGRLCPAGVYEWKEGRLVVNAPNCVDCKATDVLGPRWRPREGGSGPAYRRM